MSDLFKDIATPEKVDGNRDDGEEQDAAMKSGKSTTNMLKGSKASPSSLLSSPISAVADPSAIPSSPVEDTPSRPKRKRGAPSRYSDEEEKRRAEAAIASTARPKRRRGGKKINFDASYLLEAKSSVLTRIDLRNIFNDQRAWTSLTKEQRCTVLEMMNYSPKYTPDTIPDDLPNIPGQILAGSTAFRTDLRLYQEDLAEGRMDPAWRRRAEQASKERAEGKFDDWKEKERELWWGQKTGG